MSSFLCPWAPSDRLTERTDQLIKKHRKDMQRCLEPLVSAHYPELIKKSDDEFRKMIELSTKMTLVGHCCAEIAGYPFDDRRVRISALFGACCFLADSFLDDFGDVAAYQYIDRFELMLTKGWFDVMNEREELFYVVTTRLFAERDMLNPTLRQAIFGQHLAQKRDVKLRMDAERFMAMPESKRLSTLKICARDRGGYVAVVLALLLVPKLSLNHHQLLFLAGAIFMFIDDHGDCYYDRYYNRITYMNQVNEPAKILEKLFNDGILKLRDGLQQGPGQEILMTFLFRYFVTRLDKHMLEKDRGKHSWTVYE